MVGECLVFFKFFTVGNLFELCNDRAVITTSPRFKKVVSPWF